jgi:hypothetical protein
MKEEEDEENCMRNFAIFTLHQIVLFTCYLFCVVMTLSVSGLHSVESYNG